MIAVYDACVLYPSALRDYLIWLAHLGLVQARWTEAILDEVFSSLMRNRRDLDPQRLLRTRRLMNVSLPDVLVEGYEDLIVDVVLPDSGDRHVLAAAITCDADVIVTHNLRDFPDETLAHWKLQAITPDELTLRLMSFDTRGVIAALTRMAAGWRNPSVTIHEALNQLERDGLPKAASELRQELR